MSESPDRQMTRRAAHSGPLSDSGRQGRRLGDGWGDRRWTAKVVGLARLFGEQSVVAAYESGRRQPTLPVPLANDQGCRK